MTEVIPGTEAVWLGREDAPAAVLLLHGFVGSRIDFADLGERLAERGFRVRMARLPGHGTTPEDFARVTAEDLIAAAREELAALRADHERVYLVGFSMGGALALLTGAEAEPPPDGIVLLAPFFEVTYIWYYLLPPRVWNAAFAPLVAFVPKTDRYVKVNRRESVPEMFSYRRVPTSGARQLDRLGKMAGDPAVLAKVEAPLLLIHAEGDEAASPDAARKAFARIGSDGKKAHWYGRDINHHLLWDHEAEDAKGRVVEFLEELESRHRYAE